MKNWSRKKKLLLCIPILLVSLFFIASITQWPSPTLEIAIRRKEKQQLIGPSEIIGQLEYDYGRIILGKTEYGQITYEYTDDLGWDNGELRYFPNEEQVTMFCPDFLLWTDHEQWLPIFAVPDNRKAFSGEMTISVVGIEESEFYRLKGEKQDGGYFLFSLPGGELGPECFWLLQQSITNSYQEYVLTGTVEIQIDFYDQSGELIDTYTKTVTKQPASPRRKIPPGALCLIQFQNQLQSLFHCLFPDFLPVTCKGESAACDPLVIRVADEHQTHGIAPVVAAGTGQARDGHGDIRTQCVSGAQGHGFGNGRGHST